MRILQRSGDGLSGMQWPSHDHCNHDDLEDHQRDYFQYCKLQYRLNLTTKRFMQPYVILVKETLMSLLN